MNHLRQNSRDQRTARSPSASVAFFSWCCLLSGFLSSFVSIVPMATSAQPPTVENSTDRTDGTTPGRKFAESSEMETVYVRDEDGRLVPVVNLSYNEFLQLYELKRELRQAVQTPEFVIDSMAITAEVVADRANVVAKLEVRLMRDGETRVPLQFDGAILDSFSHSAVNEEQDNIAQDADAPTIAAKVTLAPAAGAARGFDCWISGREDDRFRLSLECFAKLQRSGGESLLELKLPRATQSEFKLIQSGKSTIANLDGGQLISSTLTNDGNTEFTINGLASLLRFGWREVAAPIRAANPVIDVQGRIRADVRSPEVVTSQVQLRVSSSGGPIQQLAIGLPASATPIIGENADYRLSVETRDERQVLLVDLKNETFGPQQIEFTVEQTPADSDRGPVIDIGNFEVEGAFRHEGILTVTADPEWLVRWDDSVGVHRLDQLPEGPLDENHVAAFRYYRQPVSLPIRIRGKQTRVQSTPTYIIDVGRKSATVRAIFDTRIQGAAAESVQIEMADWEILEVKNPEQFNEENLALSESMPLDLPFNEPRRGNLQLEVVGYRRMDIPASGAEQDLEFSLPFIRDAMKLPANVVVTADNELSVAGRSKEMTAFESATLGGSIPLSESRDRRLSYRFRGDPAKSKLKLTASQREQSVLTDILTEVKVQGATAAVVHRLKFNVRFQPLHSLEVQVPRGANVGNDWRWTLDGQELEVSAAAPIPSSSPQEGATTWDIPLAQPRTGTFTLEARYERPFDPANEAIDLADGSASAPMIEWTIPAPGDCVVTSNRLRIVSRSSLEFNVPNENAWSLLARSIDMETGLATSEFESSKPQPLTTQVAYAAIPESRGKVTVDRMFVQSWLAESERRDRMVVGFQSDATKLELNFPAGVARSQVIALLNGQPVQIDESGRIEVAPSDDDSAGSYRLELVYPFKSRPARGRLQLQRVTIAESDWVPQMYWQVITGSRERLLIPPDALHDENQWAFQGWELWKRVPGMDLSDLESWSDGTTQPSPGTGTNQYLFGGFGKVPEITLTTIDRKWLLFSVAGIVLLITLAVSNWRHLRRPWVALPLAAGLLTAAHFYPHVSRTVAHAALIGLGLSAIYLLMRRLIGPRPPNRLEYRDSSMHSSLQARDSQRSTQLPTPLRAEGGSSEQPSNLPTGAGG